MRHYVKFGLLASVVALTACTDSSYDFNDVDWTLGTHADITLPSSSTAEIYLRSFMDLKEEGILKLIKNGTDSMFVVEQTGKADIKPINLGEITVAKPNIDPISNTVTLDASAPASRAPRRINVNINIDGKSYPVNVPSYSYTIQDNQGKTTLKETKATGISKDVLTIEKIQCKDDKVVMTITTTDVPDFMQKVRLNDMTLTLPKEINIKACDVDGYAAKSIEPGKVVLTEGKDEHTHNVSKMTVTVTISGIEQGSNFVFDAASHVATLKASEVKLSGSFCFYDTDMDEAKLKTYAESMASGNKLTNDEKTKLAAGDFSPLIPKKLSYTANSKFENDLTATNFTGDIKHEFEAIDPIELNDIPDFLNNPQTVIDLDNPLILVSLQTTFPSDVTSGLIFSSATDGNRARSTGDILVKGNNVENLYYIANQPESTYLPADYKSAQYVHVDSVTNLVKIIPKTVQVSVAPATMHCDAINLSKTYPVNADYRFYAPVVFGKEFLLVYSTTEDDWDMTDIDKLDCDSIAMDAEVSSNIESRLAFKIVPIDKTGKEIEQLQVIGDKDLLNAVDVPANADKYPIHLVVKPSQGTQKITMRDVFAGTNGVPQLDGIYYEAKLHDATTSTKPLTNKNYVKLTNIKIKLKGTVSYDAN